MSNLNVYGVAILEGSVNIKLKLNNKEGDV